MATHHGTFGEFCPDKKKTAWIACTERLIEQYFQANEVDAAEMRRAILLSVYMWSINVSAYQRLSGSRTAKHQDFPRGSTTRERTPTA